MAMLITIIVPVFAVIVMGRLAVLRGFVEAAAVRGMSDLVFYVAMPCLLFDSIVRAESMRVADSTAIFLLVSLVIYALGMVAAMVALRLPFAPAAVTGLNSSFGNAVMMGIPIVVAAFGADALPPLLGIITIHSAIILPLAPALMLGGGWWLGLTDTGFKVAALIAGMPTGANAFLLARRTETATEASAATVVAATGLSVFSLTPSP